MKPTAPAILPLKVAGLFTVVGSTLLLAGHAAAAPLATDSFATTSDGSGGTYSTATLDSRLYGQNATSSVSGFSAGWSNGTPLSTAALRVETSGLTHSLLQGTAAAGDIYGVRNSAGAQTRTVTRALSSDVNTAISNQEASGGEFWFSSLTTVNQGSSGGAFFGVGNNVRHDTAISEGIQIFTGSGRIELYNGTTELTSAGGGENPNTRFTVTLGLTYLVAIKVDFSNIEGNDSVTMLIYSPTASYDSPTYSFTATGLTLDASDFGYLGLNVNAGNGFSSDSNTPRFDEFRLGLSQSDVMVVPEPASVALLGLGLTAVLFRSRRRSA